MPKIRLLSLSEEETTKEIDFTFKSDKSEQVLNSLVFEAINVENQNSRQGSHSTKTKGEVSGTGKKPYKQKHTGRARQGSRRNPQFRGGGVVFGPNPNKNYKIKINKKKYRLGLLSTWNNLFNSGNMALLDDTFLLEEAVLGTKNFLNFLKKYKLSENKILVIASKDNQSLYLSSRNLQNIIFRTIDSYSLRDLLNQNYLLIPEDSMDSILKKFHSWR